MLYNLVRLTKIYNINLFYLNFSILKQIKLPWEYNEPNFPEIQLHFYQTTFPILLTRLHFHSTYQTTFPILFTRLHFPFYLKDYIYFSTYQTIFSILLTRLHFPFSLPDYISHSLYQTTFPFLFIRPHFPFSFLDYISHST